MRRLSIARSVGLALLGLTILFAVLAALGVATLYQSRQRYENRLSASYALQSAAEHLLTVAVIEQTTARLVGPRAPVRGRTAARTAHRLFESALVQVRALAASDPASAALAEAAASREAVARVTAVRGSTGAMLAAGAQVRTTIERLVARQGERQAMARAQARHDSRRDLAAIGVAALLALAAMLALVWLLVSRVRGPLNELVEASARLAHGDLQARVHANGPQELRDVAGAFNAMADDLAEALARLQDERERLAQIIHSLGDALLVVEADGTIVAANPQAASLLPECRPGLHVDDQTGVLPPLDDALGHEVTLERAGRVLAATAAFIGDADADTHSVVWTVRDVTERARLERLKSEFVATASHELRSPLTSIKGFVELLERGRDLDPRQREFVDIIRVSTDRLVDLVNDLLDVARIEAGQMEISPRPVDVRDIVRETATLLGPRLRARHQRLHFDAPEEPLPLARVHADPTRLRQILVNLLTNAHQYTPEGGRVTIAVREEPERLALRVSDDGPGIGPEELDRIFDRFYRGPEQARGGGTGLGLSIVKSLVDIHGGTIDVRSPPGEGTTFTVRLPFALGERPQPASDPGPRVTRTTAPTQTPTAATDALVGVSADEPPERR